MSLPIRLRLTLWYSAVLSLVLALCAVIIHVLYARSRLAHMDEELARAAALVAALVPEELEEGATLAAAARDALEDIHMPGRSLAVFDAGGALLAGSTEGMPAVSAESAPPAERTSASVATPRGAFRFHRRRYRFEETTYQVGAAESLDAVDRELAGLQRALLTTVLVTLVLAAGGGWWIARGALRPVTDMAAQSTRITDRSPGFRLSAPNPHDELGRLAEAFNDLLDRLETALAQQRQFMADASHELRTPVSVARTAIEVTVGRDGRPEDEYRDCLTVVAEQMRRLSRIVEDLFTLARADASGLPLDEGPLYLDELVADCVKEMSLVASPKGVRLAWTGPGDLPLHGDERRLRQMIVNLLGNAVRHTPARGEVRLDLAVRGPAVELEITDTGEGIPTPDRERVFDRFVRLDPARAGEGAGLGLPIARAIAEAHGGALTLARSDASGSTFVVRLPRRDPAT